MALFSDLDKIKSPNEVLQTAYKNISSTDKFAYCTGFIICLLVNAFTYTNTCFAHDSIQIYNDSTGITNGRFLVGPLLELTNRMQIPWIIGLLTCFILGFVIVYISKIFKLSNKISIVLCAGFVVTSEAMVSAHAYFNSVYIYALALLFSILAVYYVDYPKYGFLISSIFLIFSMMCYQAYISTAISLFIVKMLFNLLEANNKIKKQIFITFKYASITIVSTIIYFGLWKLILKLLNTEIVDYYAYDNIDTIPTFSDILNRINYAWTMALQLLYRNDMIQVHPLLMISGSLLFLIAIITITIKSISKHRFIFSTIYIITYIVSINLMYIISGTTISPLTIFSIIIPFLIVVYILDVTPKQKLLSWFSLILCSIMIFGQAISANSLYLKTKVNYDNAWSYSTRVIDRLEQMDGFNEHSKIIIIGDSQHVLKYPQNSDIIKRSNYDTRINILVDPITANNAITYASTLKWFINQEMDMAIEIEVNNKEIRDLQCVKDMPAFPYENSIKEINGIFIVKLSNYL